jgi:hypothetical protein
MRGGVFTALIALPLSTAASAQSVTLTKDDGRPLVVGDAAELGAGLDAGAMPAQAIVSEFQRVCLPDPAGAPARIAGSTLELEDAEAVFPAAGKQQEARVSQWRGRSATLSVWTGDDANLKGRPIAIPSRGSTTTGPYGPFRAEGAQCNLVVAVNDFAVVTQLSDALTAAFGSPGKLVSKKNFADGHWLVPGAASAIRINFTTPTTHSGPHPVHLSAQVLEKGSKR